MNQLGRAVATSRLVAVVVALVALCVVSAGGWAAAQVLAGSGDPVTGSTTSTSSSPVSLADRTTGIRVSCSSSSMSYTLDPGAKVSGGIVVGSVTASTWNNCVGPSGVRLAVAQQGTWSVQSASGLSDGTGTIRLIGVRAHISTTSGPSCSLDVAGSATATVNLQTKQITVSSANSAVTASNVTGCSGAVRNGDTVGIDAPFTLA